jgi:toxin ParE1/3/4
MPPVFHLILSPEAVANIQQIHDYISRDAPRNAAKVVERILDAMKTLEEFPHRNIVEHQSTKLKHPVRSIVVRPYLIFFRVIESQQVVRILSVRHAARRRPARFDTPQQ